MARINLRDLSDDVHHIISQAALRNHRSVEGEARHALDLYAKGLHAPNEVPAETAKKIWQKGVSLRLENLFSRLRDDDFFAYKVKQDVPHIALAIGEDSPAQLIDCLDGQGILTFDMLNRIVAWSSCSFSWLLSGVGTMFAVEDIGTDRSFFTNEFEDRKDLTFYLVRISSGRNEGMILCVKHNKVTNTYKSGYISAQFNLIAGMGATGHSNLDSFIVYLKTFCHKHHLSSYEYEEVELSTELGLHHPTWYLRRIRNAQWLMQLFNGEDPDNWLEGYSEAWEDIRKLPFGGRSQDSLRESGEK